MALVSIEIRRESDRASAAALSLWTLSKMSSVSGIFLGLRFQDSTHLVAHPVEHAADCALVRKFCGRVALLLDQHFAHGFGGQTRVLEQPLKFRVRLRMRLDQIDDVLRTHRVLLLDISRTFQRPRTVSAIRSFRHRLRQLRIGLFGFWLASARRIGDDPAGVELPDSPGDGVPGPAKDGFGEPRVAAQIVQADARLKSPPCGPRELPGSVAHRINRFRGQFFHHSPP